MNSDYFPIHAHSEFSTMDGMGTVEDMVRKAVKNGHPALSLTDHGSMGGVIRLYKESKKAGLAPFPGCEFYVVTDVNDVKAKEDRYHLGMLALDYHGYKGMIQLSSRSHQRDRFHRKPLIDFDDLAQFGSVYGDHVVVTTGCFFGLVLQTLIRRGDKAAHQMIEMLFRWFPNLAVEVQYHGIEEKDHSDSDLADWLFDAAAKHGLPILLGQDSHYCDADDQEVHDLMKDICYFGNAEDDNHFPGGPYDLAPVEELMEPWRKSEWAKIEQGHEWLLNKHALAIPALDKYKFHVPKVSNNADQDLRDACKAAIFTPTGPTIFDWDDTYQDRLDHELAVIKKMGFADYFLLVKEVVDWCAANNVVVNTRGSANGSLVCYLTGITKVDPIQWDTRFDRFLSLSRAKPPDIDLDVESRGRAALIEHLRKKFPSMVHIGTYTRLGITEQDDGSGDFEDKGSVFVQYMAAMRRKYPKTFNNQVQPEHRATLNKLAQMEVRKALGTHAAGLVLPTKEHRIEDLLATGLVASSNTTVTQAVMEDVEDAGFVKLDVLGLRTLETLSTALANLGKRADEWDWLPWDDKKACALLSSGNTDGIFQFEGWTTRKGAKEMKIRNTMDAIVCLALYRPALINGGQKDRYLGNRGKKRGKRPYDLHPFFDDVLSLTYGVPVFQEQVMAMCLNLGMEEDMWNSLMKAVKASNDKIGQYAIGIMEEVEPTFYDLCEDNGLSGHDADDAWHAILGFTDYGFNKAHAVSYGIAGYRAAYLKAHHPLEFMHAALDTWVGTDKEQTYVQEARSIGFQIARADVSYSGVSWSIDKNRYKGKQVLRRGLASVKGVGVKAAEAIVDNRPTGGWESLADFVDAMPARPVSGGKSWKATGDFNGVMRVLNDVGALASLGSNVP